MKKRIFQAVSAVLALAVVGAGFVVSVSYLGGYGFILAGCVVVGLLRPSNINE